MYRFVISTPVILNGGYIYRKRPPLLRSVWRCLGFLGIVFKTLYFESENPSPFPVLPIVSAGL